MKTLSKLIAAAFITAGLFTTTNVNAQTTPANALRLGFGLEAGAPTGNAHVGSNFEMGGTARLQYGLSNSFAITLTSGAYHLFGKQRPGTDTDYKGYGIIPVKAGIKAFFAQNIYFGAETGVGFEVTGDGFGLEKFILSPALGYANTHWDVGIRYENFSGGNDSYGLVGLRLAYGFGL